jgi:proteasome lid subunit RPN8/RPN11
MDLFVWPRVLREITTLLSTPGGHDGYGMLAGRLCHCPVSGTSYLNIEDAYSAPNAVPQGAHPSELGEFKEFWLSISMKVSVEQRELVGWYHAHPRLGISFSKSDERLHSAHFPNRWQCALVLSSDAGAHEAGFFQRDSKTGAFRSTPAPFFEVLPEDGLRGEPVRSDVIWANYRADRSVLRSWVEPGKASFELVGLGIGNGAGGLEAAANGQGEPIDGAIDQNQAVESTERANGDAADAETGGAPAPPIIQPRSRRRRAASLALTVSSGVTLAAAALMAAAATDRIDLSVLGQRVGLELSAPAQADGQAGAIDYTADGQAGAVPLAHGQVPGAPSADNDPVSAETTLDVRLLRAEIEAYEALQETGEADCERLTTTYLRIEAAAGSLNAADLEVADLADLAAVEAVRRDFATAGCSAP